MEAKGMLEKKVEYLLGGNGDFGAEQVKALDMLTTSILNGTAESQEALKIWETLKDDHYFWARSEDVFRLTQVDHTKVLMLIVLENAIKQKWKALFPQQREGIKKFVVALVFQYGAMDTLTKSQNNVLSKANSTLVHILKYQWNTTWVSFISELCSASQTNMSLCENNLSILKMLSEEIFDYSKNEMTQQQVVELKGRMSKDFQTIFHLCEKVLNNLNNVKPTLVKGCLETLNAFLSWIPMYYIVWTPLIEKLVLLLESNLVRSQALSCLVEIAGLDLAGHTDAQRQKYLLMLRAVTDQLMKLIPMTADPNAIDQFLGSIKKSNRVVFELLTRGIALFYSEFFRTQISWLELYVQNNTAHLFTCQQGLQYLVLMMRMGEDQVFRIVVEFFHFFLGSFMKSNDAKAANPPSSQILTMAFNPIFLQLTKTVAYKMAKPEQVLIVIDEQGYPVREENVSTENSSLYEVMKDLSSYLAQYNWESLRNFLINELELQRKQELFGFNALNSLCWAMGTLCGTVVIREERSFFVKIIKTLLELCEMKKGKENKAVIAANIMYLVGQYPSFLKTNWNFLRTVVKKLFEFMKEPFPGVKEMSCNSFLKICRSNASSFVMPHGTEEPFIQIIIRGFLQITNQLHTDQLLLTFYMSVGHLISAESQSQTQLQYMIETLNVRILEFRSLIQSSIDVLKNPQVQQKLIQFLKINGSLALGVGKQYVVLLEQLAEPINNLYLYYSNEVKAVVQQEGLHVLNFNSTKQLRLIKKQVIKIYIGLLTVCDDLNYDEASFILSRFIYPLGTLLADFRDSLPQTKEQQFVKLFTLVIEKLHLAITGDFLEKLIEMIFSSSLPLITTDFNSFPEIRANFFSFLKAIILHTFNLLYQINANNFKVILDCVVWSFRHELTTYSDLGLDLLDNILTKVSTDINTTLNFYKIYGLKLLSDVLDVGIDGFHKSGFDLHSKLLFSIISNCKQNNGIILSDVATTSNAELLFSFISQKLVEAFPNTDTRIVAEKVGNWIRNSEYEQFKGQFADFLVIVNQFTAKEAQEKSK